MSDTYYYEKYLKYKLKYYELKYGGDGENIQEMTKIKKDLSKETTFNVLLNEGYLNNSENTENQQSE
jgi:hypothetical protein